MEQENADGKMAKKKRLLIGLAVLCLLGCVLYAVKIISNKQLEAWSVLPIEGTIVILNENAEIIPFLPTELRCFSVLAPGFFHSVSEREPKIRMDESGQFQGKMPESPTTLLFNTEDGKYAAIVDVMPNGQTTGLVIELRLRYTVTGRLVDDTGTPLTNHIIKLGTVRNYRDFGVRVPPIDRQGHSHTGVTLHSERTTTDSEGFFTIDNMIPGNEYKVFAHQAESHESRIRTATLEMPILHPEQYREPFSLGDVSTQCGGTIRFLQ